MLNRVRLNTCVVDGKREARTVLAINAAFVESEAGNLKEQSALEPSLICQGLGILTSLLDLHRSQK